MSSIPASPAPQRSKNHHKQDDPDHPIDRTEKARHRRLQVGDCDQRPFDDDCDCRQTKNSGQMSSICSLHRML
jgi:hypothetical protein